MADCHLAIVVMFLRIYLC